MMRGISATDRAVDKLLRDQCQLITRSQALTAGLSKDYLRHRLREEGPWKIVLPGIYLAHNGLLAAGQREMAAVLYAGQGSVITGPAALSRVGVRVPVPDVVDVLIPAAVKRQSVSFVRIHRTTKLPDRPLIIDGLRWAPAPRAVADAARDRMEVAALRALVADAVQKRTCTIGQLLAELHAGPRQGSGALRSVVDEAAAGIASIAEGDLRKLIMRAGLPEPLYNPRLYVGSEFLAKPDAWWPDAGVAAEVDSREWHLSPADWEKTMARHARMSARGIIVLHFPPSRIRRDPAGVTRELTLALEAGRRRQPLEIRAVSAA